MVWMLNGTVKFWIDYLNETAKHKILGAGGFQSSFAYGSYAGMPYFILGIWIACDCEVLSVIQLL